MVGSILLVEVLGSSVLFFHSQKDRGSVFGKIGFNTPKPLSILLRDGELKFLLSSTISKTSSRGYQHLLLIKSFPTTVILLETELWIESYGFPKFLALIGPNTTSFPCGVLGVS
jgi:hypothetical protein